MGRLTELLGVELPLLQAGMGGVAGPELAGAVSDAGAAGAIGLFKLRGEPLHDLIAETRARTARPVGINLIPELVPADHVEEQVAAIARAAPPVHAVSYGSPPAELVRVLHSAGVPVLAQVGTLMQAEAARSAGADALIAQGTGAGGHHLGESGVLELVEAVRGLGVPIVAAGGLAPGALKPVLQAGAEGVLLGTAFVATVESRAHPLYKRRVLEATAADTVVTDTFEIGWPGRRHRVLRNDVVGRRGELPSRFIARTRIGGREYPVARFSTATPTCDTCGAVGEMAMYCGAGCGAFSTLLPAARVVAGLRAELVDS